MSTTEAPTKTWRCLDCGARVHQPVGQTERPPCRKDPSHKLCVPVERVPVEDTAPAKLLRVARELTAAKRELKAQAETVERAQKEAVEAAGLRSDAEERAKASEARFTALEGERDAARQELAALQSITTEGEQAALLRLQTETGLRKTAEGLTDSLKAQLAAVQEGRSHALLLVSRWRLAFWIALAAGGLSHFLR